MSKPLHVEALDPVDQTFAPTASELSQGIRQPVWAAALSHIDSQFGPPKTPYVVTTPSEEATAPAQSEDDAIQRLAKERSAADANGVKAPGIADAKDNRLHDALSSAVKEIAQKDFGNMWGDLNQTEQNQLIEYRTQRILDKQFGEHTDYSLWGTIKSGFREGISSFTPDANLDRWIASNFPSMGGEFFGVNPRTGQREFWLGYDEMIPGFMDMNKEQRLKAVQHLQDLQKQRYQAEVDAKPDGVVHGASMFAGALATPTTLVPMTRATSAASYARIALEGGAFGAGDAMIYDLGTHGHIKPEDVFWGAAFGSIGAPGLAFAGKKLGGVLNKARAGKIVDKYESAYNGLLAEGVHPEVADAIARIGAQRSTVLTSDGLTDLYALSGKTKNVPSLLTKEGKRVSKAALAQHARSLLDDKTSFLAKFHLLNVAKDKIDYAIRPISDYFRMSPKIYKAIQQMELGVHESAHNWSLEVQPFFKQLGKMSHVDQKELQRLLMHDDAGKWAEAYNLLNKYENQGGKFEGLTNNFDVMREVLKEIHVSYKQAGYKDMEYIKHYFPRVALDAGLNKKLTMGWFKKRLYAYADSKGIPRDKITDYHVQKVANDLLQFKGKPKGRAATSGSLKPRELDELNTMLMDHYANMPASFHSYVRMAALDIERAKFFNKFVPKGRKYDLNGADINPKNVRGWMANHLQEIGLMKKTKNGIETSKHAEDILQALQSRFTMGEMSPNGFWKAFKNLGYTTTIANPLGAVTQLQDNSFSFYKHGIRATFKAMFQGIDAPGTPGGLLEKESLGLTNALEEIYSNPAKFKAVLDKTMKWSGFNRLDKFGKDVNIKAAIYKAQRQLSTEKGQRQFFAEWGRYFDTETASLIEDLKKVGKPVTRTMVSGKKVGKEIQEVGKLTDNVKVWLWNQLADTQPISLSEMPRGYLDHPNGRVFYMLKTFTVKQVDFMRRQILREWHQGNKASAMKNLTYFATFWTALGGSADALKSVITGDDVTIGDHMVRNFQQLFLYNRYSAGKIGQEGVTGGVARFLMPPAPWLDKPVEDIWKLTHGQKVHLGEDLMSLVPVIGTVTAKVLKNKRKKTAELLGPAASNELLPKDRQKELFKGISGVAGGTQGR